jgi:beta-lactamase regulating signal transducer with metallopeptidase domain/HEAT repeat protein
MIDSIVEPIVRGLGLSIFIMATAIMAVAGVLTYKFKKSSAEIRYTIWGVAFFLLIILPVASTVPTWMVLEIDGLTTTVPVYPDNGNMGESIVKASQNEFDAATAAPVDVVRTDSRNMTPAGSKVIFVVLFSTWLLVTLFLISRFILQILRVGGITRRALRVNGGKLGGDIDHLMTSLGIRRRMRVMLSGEVSMPFAWGIFHPVIILPGDAAEWPQDRIHSVLTHELAHIDRWDYPIHIIIEIVRALYWPNPIVWFAARKSVMERERACDDFALRSGTSYVDYAEHLLHIAKIQIEGNIPVAAVTMAGEPGLKERISHVMNRKMNRAPMRRGVLLITSALIALLALPIGSTAVKKSSWMIPETKGLIKQLSESKNAGERSVAAWWLGEHETRKAVGSLVDALEDKSRSVRLTSAWALGEIKDRDSIDGLIEALESEEDLLVKEMTVLALGEIEHRSAVDALVAAYESDEQLALVVIWALGEIARRGSDDADDARVEIIDDLGERPWRNEQVWTGTLKKKRLRSKDVESLIEDLSNEDGDGRCQAAFALGRLGIEQDYETMAEVEMAVRALIHALEDPAPEVRAMAIWSLDEVNPSRKKTRIGFFKKK